jgi:hypothetical protein
MTMHANIRTSGTLLKEKKQNTLQGEAERRHQNLKK